jgi:hypothetical protein
LVTSETYQLRVLERQQSVIARALALKRSAEDDLNRVRAPRVEPFQRAPDPVPEDGQSMALLERGEHRGAG